MDGPLNQSVPIVLTIDADEKARLTKGTVIYRITNPDGQIAIYGSSLGHNLRLGVVV